MIVLTFAQILQPTTSFSSPMDTNFRARASLSPIRPRCFSTHLTFILNLVCYRILFPHIETVPISSHEIYFSSISTFLNFLILKYQSMDTTPFETHPKTVAAAVLSFLLLACSGGVDGGAISGASRFACFFWLFTLASLVSLLLPDWVRPILYMLCFGPLVFELLGSLYGRIWRAFEDWFDVVRILIARKMMINRRETGRLPV